MVSPRRLLMVDGDPAVQELLIGTLKRDDRDVQGVYDGKEALDCLRDTTYDLVVAGQGRNGLGGIKLLRSIQAAQPDAKVILTGDRSATQALAAFRAKAYSYFHKPLTPGPLAD